MIWCQDFRRLLCYKVEIKFQPCFISPHEISIPNDFGCETSTTHKSENVNELQNIFKNNKTFDVINVSTLLFWTSDFKQRFETIPHPISTESEVGIGTGRESDSGLWMRIYWISGRHDDLFRSRVDEFFSDRVRDGNISGIGKIETLIGTLFPEYFKAYCLQSEDIFPSIFHWTLKTMSVTHGGSGVISALILAVSVSQKRSENSKIFVKKNY